MSYNSSDNNSVINPYVGEKKALVKYMTRCVIK